MERKYYYESKIDGVTFHEFYLLDDGVSIERIVVPDVYTQTESLLINRILIQLGELADKNGLTSIEFTAV